MALARRVRLLAVDAVDGVGEDAVGRPRRAAVKSNASGARTGGMTGAGGTVVPGGTSVMLEVLTDD